MGSGTEGGVLTKQVEVVRGKNKKEKVWLVLCGCLLITTYLLYKGCCGRQRVESLPTVQTCPMSCTKG